MQAHEETSSRAISRVNQTLLDRAEEIDLHVKGIEAKTDANALRLASHEETSSRAISRVNQTLLDRAEEIDLHVKGIEAKTDASALRLASYEETSARAIANVSHTLFQLQGKLDTLSTGLVYPIGTVTHDGQCMEPVPGSDMIGRFVDPRTMNIGRSAVELSCQDGKKYRNPFDEHGSSEIEYDLPDPIATVTHHAETDASASVNTFQNVDQKRQAVASEKGFNIGFMGILSVGVSEATQRMTGFFRDARSRVYEVVRRFGSFEAILKGNLDQYLVPEVKDALNALPRAYGVEHRQKFIDFFNRYGPFFVDQVWNGGKITATVVLSSATEIEAENSASATVSGIKASVGDWAVGFGSGGADASSSFAATIRSKSSSHIQVVGGDHANPSAFDVRAWTSDDYERWSQTVRRSPKPIHYRVRSAAELTNDPELKAALRAAISDIFGDMADDVSKYEELTQSYYSLREQVNGLAIPSGGRRSVTFDRCEWVTPIHRGQQCGGTDKPTCCEGDGVVANFHSQHHSAYLHWFMKVQCCYNPHVDVR